MRGARNRVWSERTGVRGWSVVETQWQWAGMRLHRTSACGKLVKEHFSLRVADFVWTRVLKSWGSSDSVGFLFFRETAVSVSRCVEEACPFCCLGHALFT